MGWCELANNRLGIVEVLIITTTTTIRAVVMGQDSTTEIGLGATIRAPVHGETITSINLELPKWTILFQIIIVLKIPILLTLGETMAIISSIR